MAASWSKARFLLQIKEKIPSGFWESSETREKAADWTSAREARKAGQSGNLAIVKGHKGGPGTA